jgi:CRP-like cAMP-binding protein
MDGAPFDLRENRLLWLLEDSTLRALAPQFEPVRLASREALWPELQPIAHAWFPVDCVLSMLAMNADGETSIEVATIGSEGVLGVPLFLGAEVSPGLVFAQIEGTAWRMPAAAFRQAAADHADFARVLQHYTQALLVQIAQGAACNRVHGIGQRCARWLLQTHDRVRGDAFDLTQEFLAHMLGERRAAVNQAASQLQTQGLIRYTRGRLQVVDRPGLEAAACPCYGIIRDQYVRMLAPQAP